MEEHNSEHTEHVHKVKKNNLLRDKPWVVSTFVLGILVVLILVLNFSGVTGKTISGTKAGENILNFATSQGLTAEVVNVTAEGSFYKVILAIDGNDIPVYVTKDGKYFTSSLIPLTTTKASTSTTDTTTQAQEIPKLNKPVVELFVMSYCPYGTQAEKGILPVVELLGSKIDFKIRFVYYAMHPTLGEVEENLRQYCIQKEQSTKFNDYLSCFLDAGNSTSCLTTVKIDKTKLNSCTTAADKQFQISDNKNDKSKWLSGNYPLFNIDKTLNEQYNVAGSPTLVINGVQANSARDPASYLDIICQSFTDGSVPTECGQTLSTTAYSAGFGYSGTGSTTAAQCA
jgi:protein-disulfide isomerase